LVEQLRALDFDAHGIDLREPTSPFCVQSAIEDYVCDEPFDLVVARFSIHHTRHLGRIFERIRSHLPSGAPFVMQEFSWTAFGEDALRWTREHANAPGPDSRTVDLWSGSTPAVFRRWAERYGDLHALEPMLYAADAFFVRRDLVAVPYLGWLIDRPEIVAPEREAIRRGSFAPLAYIYVGDAR
jgi:hypothetical protein